MANKNQISYQGDYDVSFEHGPFSTTITVEQEWQTNGAGIQNGFALIWRLPGETEGVHIRQDDAVSSYSNKDWGLSTDWFHDDNDGDRLRYTPSGTAVFSNVGTSSGHAWQYVTLGARSGSSEYYGVSGNITNVNMTLADLDDVTPLENEE